MAYMRNIRVVPYDPAWERLYAEESRRLRLALGPVLLDIEHVGSTAVPGLDAKPLVDIMLVVRDLEELDTCNPRLAELGYEAEGALFVPRSRFFSKGPPDSRTHHLHAYPTAHPEIEELVDFRDYLRAHPEEARGYGALKARLARDHRDDLLAYIRGKRPLLNELKQRACEWRRSQNG